MLFSAATQNTKHHRREVRQRHGYLVIGAGTDAGFFWRQCKESPGAIFPETFSAAPGFLRHSRVSEITTLAIAGFLLVCFLLFLGMWGQGSIGGQPAL